jgi:hypothetical protein
VRENADVFGQVNDKMRFKIVSEIVQTEQSYVRTLETVCNVSAQCLCVLLLLCVCARACVCVCAVRKLCTGGRKDFDDSNADRVQLY